MMNRTFILLFMISLFGCEPEVEVYAPERPTFIVYGVLDVQADAQFIKLTQTFQSEGDALAYAADADLSLTDLKVTLEGNGTVYEGELAEIQRESGVFPSTHTLYKFNTSGANRIEGEKPYTLTIRDPDDTDFLISATTLVPGDVNLVQPAAPRFNPSLGVYFLPILDLKDDFTTLARSTLGYGFEVRVYIEYEQGGEVKALQYGPLPIQNEPKGCLAAVGRGEMCIKIPGESVGNFLNTSVDHSQGPIFHYDTVREAGNLSELSRLARMEVTAVDSFLTRYLQANNPFGFGLNLLIDKPELSNVTGADAGLFGSINYASHYFMLDECTKYVAGFIPAPPTFCN